jgi:hypothetical protein
MAYCNVPQPRLVCAEYFASQMVVEATLIRVSSLHDKDDPEGISARVYTLRVNRIFRGKEAGTIRVYEGNDSGRATFDWVRGKQYLLFLFYAASEKSWALDGCGNSGPLGRAGMALSEISAIKAARNGGGVIHGIVSQQALSNPIQDVQVEASGATGRYTATTNEKGEFVLKVPAGRYVVRVIKNQFTFSAADIGYENPRKIRIEPGGCAQVQFSRVENLPTL